MDDGFPKSFVINTIPCDTIGSDFASGRYVHLALPSEVLHFKKIFEPSIAASSNESFDASIIKFDFTIQSETVMFPPVIFTLKLSKVAMFLIPRLERALPAS